MRWVVVGEAMVLVVMVLVGMCRSEMKGEAHHCDGDDGACQTLAGMHHQYHGDDHHHHAEGKHPRTSRTSTSPAPGTPPARDTAPAHGTTPDTNATVGPKTTLDPERDPHHDATLDPDHKTTPDPNLDPETDAHNDTAFEPDHETTLDPDLDLEFDPDHDTTLDPGRETTPDPDLDLELDPDHETTPDPDLDRETDAHRDTTYEPYHETTLDPDHTRTFDSDHETTPDPNSPLARQGTRRTKIPPAVGAIKFPRPFSGKTARAPQRPRPPGLPTNILWQTAFTVKKARLTRAVSDDVRLTFSEMLFNMGDAYTITGLFYCPVDAGYFFSFHATARKGYGFTLQLRKNERVVVAALVSNGTMESGSNSVFLELDRKDLISLYLVKGGAIQEGADAYTTFTGFLFNLRRRNEV